MVLDGEKKMKVTVFSQISIDGKLSLGHGNSSKDLFKLFTEDDMRFIHKFRGEVDAIMVGRNTVTTDDPQLTNRYEAGCNPVRVIPTSSLDFSDNAKVLNTPEQTIIVTTEQASHTPMADLIRDHGKEVMVSGQQQVDFHELFARLEARGMHHVMVEGGGNLNWQMFDADLVDEIILMQLPIIIGGADNVTLADGEGYRELQATKRFRLDEMKPQANYNLLRFTRDRVVN